MGYSKWFFSASGVILLVCALALGSKGINFGIDFESGTRINVELKQNVNENDVREVLRGEGLADAKIQKVTGVKDAKGASAFQISTDNLKPAEVTKVTTALEAKFGLADTPSSTSIGPTFGQTVANSAIIAIIASLVVISAYIALRFEPKYAVPVLIAVMHDILITAGVYALVGQEVTTATVAALLTILGFSLYDTIIVFDRIRENVPRMPRAAFSQIVNRSMSEVIVRSLATSFCSGLPVLALLLFGGETLQAFAFALLVGTISGTYSSVFIAGPGADRVEGARARLPPPPREHRRRERRRRAGLRDRQRERAGRPRRRKRKLRRGQRLTAPDDPDGNVSREEFEELVRDLHVDPAPRAHGGRRPPQAEGQAAAPAARAEAGAARRVGRRAARGRRHAAAATVTAPRRSGASGRRPPPSAAQARKASADGALAWTMMGLALWHFTVFLPDRCWGGIIGAFLGCVFGAVLFGFVIHGFAVPGPGRHGSHHGARGRPWHAAGLRPHVLVRHAPGGQRARRPRAPAT